MFKSAFLFFSLLLLADPASDWRQTVGPDVFQKPAVARPADEAGRLLLVNWNMHVGNGNIPGLVQSLNQRETAAGRARPEFVLLLQEGFRQSDAIPSPAIGVPRRIAPPEHGKDIEDIARELDWWVYYVPSMRNGDGTGSQAEDRGNAILSSLPLSQFEAVELPFVVQRRVALVATVTDVTGNPRLRVAVAHLDTRAPLTAGWIFGGPSARKRQAVGFVDALKKFPDDGLPLVIGADLNTALGPREGAVETIDKFAPRLDCGGRATHSSGFVLDHVFARVPGPVPACERLESTFGSDHYPLVVPLPS